MKDLQLLCKFFDKFFILKVISLLISFVSMNFLKAAQPTLNIFIKNPTRFVLKRIIL